MYETNQTTPDQFAPALKPNEYQVHFLKTPPNFFRDVVDRKLGFLIQKDDARAPYRKGDYLVLRYTEPNL